MARPTKYGKEIQAKADQYLIDYKDLDEVIPSAAGLAVYLGVSKASLYNWAKENSKFLDTLSDINAAQELKALNGGMANQYNATITKLVLANHGYSDKQEIDNKSSDGSMSQGPAVQITAEEIKSIADQL